MPSKFEFNKGQDGPVSFWRHRSRPRPGPAPGTRVHSPGIEFGGLKAVDDFSLTIGKTEIAGLIGPNGAGKTTVFNLLTKVYQPTHAAPSCSMVRTLRASRSTRSTAWVLPVRSRTSACSIP